MATEVDHCRTKPRLGAAGGGRRSNEQTAQQHWGEEPPSEAKEAVSRKEVKTRRRQGKKQKKTGTADTPSSDKNINGGSKSGGTSLLSNGGTRPAQGSWINATLRKGKQSSAVVRLSVCRKSVLLPTAHRMIAPGVQPSQGENDGGENTRELSSASSMASKGKEENEERDLGSANSMASKEEKGEEKEKSDPGRTSFAPSMGPKDEGKEEGGLGSVGSTALNSEGWVVFVVECPEHKFQRTVRMPDNSNLNDVLQKIVKKNPLENFNTYTFFLKDNKARGQLSKFEFLKDLQLPPMTTLLLIRTQVVLQVTWEHHTFSISLEPQATVKQALQLIHKIIQKRATVEKLTEYNLFLAMGKGGEIMLEEKRTISSYRFKPDTVLEFKKPSKSISQTTKSTHRLDQLLANETPDANVYLVIESIRHGIKKTLCYTSDTQVMEVMRQFNRYCKVENISAYQLAIPSSSGSDEIVLDNMQHLGHYNLSHLTHVQFREKHAGPISASSRLGLATRSLRHMRHQRADEVEQEQPPAPTVFGVDPLTLPQVEDNGFRVPALLGQLRKSLYEKDAFSQEGIFRLAGDELEMSLIKKQLNEGTYNDCIDVNAVATLIKRWFGELPVRVFAALPKEEFNRCVADAKFCATFPDKLSEPHHTLFLWLAHILVDAAKLQHINKMTPGNLAVVVSPTLAHIPDDNPIEGLVVTGRVVNILTVYLQSRLVQEQELE